MTVRPPLFSPALSALLLFFFIGLASAAPSPQAHAAEAQAASPLGITAGVYVSPPFVMENNGVFQGFAMELWGNIQKSLGIETRFVRYRSLEDIINAVKQGEVDIAVTNLTVSHDRAEALAITYPWYDTGLRILVGPDGATSVLGELAQNGQLYIYFVLVLLFLALTYALTVLRRRNEENFPANWRDGLSLSFYEIIVALKFGRLTAGVQYSWKVHLLVGLWVIFGVGIVAYVTSSMTSAMTTVSLSHDLYSFSDIYEMKVGVERGSVGERYLYRMGIRVVPYTNLEDCVTALEEGEVEAVVGDAPVLEYWVRRNPASDFTVRGAVFHPDKFAFALNPKHTDLAHKISLEIIKLHERGELQRLRTAYFGRYNL